MIRYLIAIACATLLTTPIAIAAQEVTIAAEGPVIELSVYESVTAEPDLVTIGAGVTSTAPTAVEAMRINARQMQSVIDQIRELGVSDKDIQTSGINLNPQYNYDRNTQRQIFRGYQVSNRVNVKLRDVQATGEILDALVVAGATDLTGPVFSIEDDTAAKEIARKSAIERAQKRASEYAAMFGYDAVTVLSVRESIRGTAPVAQMALRDAVAETAAAAPPVQPGQVSTGVSFSIKYEMSYEADKSAE
ncbi:MAG: SIMPL domain-containing protein [Pseudomonadota bacterium]